jgi:hypothetical protein
MNLDKEWGETLAGVEIEALFFWYEICTPTPLRI